MDMYSSENMFLLIQMGMVYDMLMYLRPMFVLMDKHMNCYMSHTLAHQDMYMMGMFLMVMCPQPQYQHYMIWSTYIDTHSSQNIYNCQDYCLPESLLCFLVLLFRWGTLLFLSPFGLNTY